MLLAAGLCYIVEEKLMEITEYSPRLYPEYQVFDPSRFSSL